MKETGLKLIIGAGAGALTYLFGGWTPLLGVLLFMVILDYITGFYAAWSEGKLSSAVGFKGIAKKVLIFALIALAHKLDIALNSPGFFKNMTIYFYIANEGLSLLENFARAGLPVPAPLKKALIQLKEKGGENQNEGVK
jgi:toxin secretion/phage lysis holin